MYSTTPAIVKIGMCSLNNNPLNFKSNRDNIIESIQKCKELGCSIRIGNEMQISGYSCADHHIQYDTMVHTWEVIRDIIESGVTKDIVCDIGCGIFHQGNLYNCRIILLDGCIKGIRAKMNLAQNSGYFENRWFCVWKQRKQVSQFVLPSFIQELTGQKTVPIGQFLIQFNDTIMAYEVCEEAWIPNNPMIDASLNGAQIFVNPAFSYIERGKLKSKIRMFQQLSDRYGGSYLYVNAKGAQGQRTYMIGDCIFVENGQIRNLAPINNLENVSVTPAMINLTSIRASRLSNKSFGRSTNGVPTIARVKIERDVGNYKEYIGYQQKQIERVRKLVQDYSFSHARYQPSMFLWDYLKKSKDRGFFLLFTGDLNSTAVALIVYNMCVLVYKQITQKNNKTVLKDLRNILEYQQFCPKSAQQICHDILYTCCMSSQIQTLQLAQNIRKKINCQYKEVSFQKIQQSHVTTCSQVLGITFNNHQLTNMQQREKMSLAYLIAQSKSSVFKTRDCHIVLSSLNLDDLLIGNFTKYGTSAGDINPIGSFSKSRLKQFLNWNFELHQFDFIKSLLNSKVQNQNQSDGNIQKVEKFTEFQLSIFGKLRRIDKLGPLSMFTYILSSKIFESEPTIIAKKVKSFFEIYSKNRHKVLTSTPSFYFNPEDCYDNRSDVRPLYYETNWQYQFEIIDEKVKQINKQVNKIKLKEKQNN